MKYYKNYLNVLVKNLNSFDTKKANHLEKKIKQVKRSKKKNNIFRKRWKCSNIKSFLS